MIKDFSGWREYEGASEGSGRSEKIWLVNPKNGNIGLFKFNKTTNTTEHISEKIASELAYIIGIESAKIDIGMYDSRIGSISYIINKHEENLIEGIQLISKYYPYYNSDTLQDESSKEYYSLDMILSSLKDYSFQNEFLSVLIFDFLIGNTDRHQNNWAIIQNDETNKLSPLYDNGSSLCCYIPDEKIKFYLGNDIQRFKSLVDSKSTSRIRINKKEKKEPKHTEVVEYLKNNYYYETINLVKKILSNINDDSINSILEKYNNDILSIKRKQLIHKFLISKLKILSKIYEM